MRIDPRSVVAPLAALIVLVFVVQQTTAALKSSGAWQPRRRGPAVRRVDPYARLDGLIGLPPPAIGGPVRDPFYPGASNLVAVKPRTGPVTPRLQPPPAPPPNPVLTAIVFDADPRATIRYDNRDFSVRENSLFAEFRVTSITSTQVVIERDGHPLVLTLRRKGE